MKDEVIIFSDGASKGNPGPGGWGAVVVVKDKVIELGGYEKHTTNNKMELTGAIRALGCLKEEGVTHHEALIYTDSRYVINGITKWIFAWKKRGWKTLQKDDVVNRDLWEQLDYFVENLNNNGVKIKWNYVGGHVGILGNERVDEIASLFAVNDAPKLFTGNISDYEYDIKNISLNDKLAQQKKEKSDGKSRSRAKAYSYVSMVNGVIQTHSTWEECEKRVKGVSATKFKKALSEIEEKAIIADWKRL
jgi:ribonuclease HI